MATAMPTRRAPTTATTTDVVVVGAGLSGLTAAFELLSQRPGLSVLVVEARGRVGGRLVSDGTDALDLGAAWTWPGEDDVQQLATTVLGRRMVPQPAAGLTVVDTPAGVQAYNMGGAQELRFVGGTAAIALALADRVRELGGTIRLSTAVVAIDAASAEAKTVSLRPVGADGAVVLPSGEAAANAKPPTDGAPLPAAEQSTTAAAAEPSTTTWTPTTVQCRRVVLAAPPRTLLQHITVSPALAPAKAAAMHGTATWMADTMKAIAVFTKPFWRDAGLAGAGQSRLGPLVQIWDNSFDASEGHPAVYALAGFIMGRDCEQLAGASAEAVSARVLPQLRRMFGESAVDKHFVRLASVNWLDEPWTHSSDGGGAGGGGRGGLGYGRTELRAPAHGIHFAGTETEPRHGHMDGAVAAGRRVARELAASLAALEG